MSSNHGTYRRNRSEAAAHAIAALIAHDGWFDWRELEFLDGAGTLQILGIQRGRFMAVLSRYLSDRGGGAALPRRGRWRTGRRARSCDARGSAGT